MADEPRVTLAQATRVTHEARDLPTAEVRRMAERASLLSMPAGEARAMRDLADSREARDSIADGRPYVAPRVRAAAPRRSRRGR